jgi:hypothetical protein
VKQKQHHETARPERLLRAAAAVIASSPIMPPDRPDQTVLRYVRELAKRLAREDHEAEIAARQVSDYAIE